MAEYRMAAAPGCDFYISTDRQERINGIRVDNRNDYPVWAEAVLEDGRRFPPPTDPPQVIAPRTILTLNVPASSGVRVTGTDADGGPLFAGLAGFNTRAPA